MAPSPMQQLVNASCTAEPRATAAYELLPVLDTPATTFEPRLHLTTLTSVAAGRLPCVKHD